MRKIYILAVSTLCSCAGSAQTEKEKLTLSGKPGMSAFFGKLFVIINSKSTEGKNNQLEYVNPGIVSFIIDNPTPGFSPAYIPTTIKRKFL